MALLELLMRKKTKLQIVVFFKKKGENVQGKNKSAGARFLIFLERERECLLSRFLVNQTVGFQRSKKESCSMWRGLRVGTGFEKFQQTP